MLNIWLRSVRATHLFLTEADIQSLLMSARDRWLVGLEVWVLMEDDDLIGFMGMYTVLGILFLFLIRREIEEGPERVDSVHDLPVHTGY